MKTTVKNKAFYFSIVLHIALAGTLIQSNLVQAQSNIYFSESFETTDPFSEETIRNIGFTTHERGLTSTQASTGNRSYVIDVTFDDNTGETLDGEARLYFKIPFSSYFPLAGDQAHLTADLKIEEISPTGRVAIGHILLFDPIPLSSVRTSLRLDKVNQNWVRVEKDLIRFAPETVTKRLGGSTVDDINGWTNTILLTLFGKPGDRFRVYVDNIKVEGQVVDGPTHREESLEKWANYKAQVMSEINQIVTNLNNYQTQLASSRFIDDINAFVSEAVSIQQIVEEHKYPNVTQYNRLYYLQSAASSIASVDENNVDTFVLFPWDAMNNDVGLTDWPTAPSGQQLSINLTPGEYEPAAFVVRALDDLSNVQVSVSDLSGPGNAVLKSTDINIRLVKMWYQNGRDTILNASKRLIPELLLNDDSLVQVDTTAQTNKLRVEDNGLEKYINISDPTATFPRHVLVADAPGLQPFDLQTGNNQLVWLTVQAPSNIPAGQYQGTITIDVPGRDRRTIQLNARVLPFTLSDSYLEQAIFYVGWLKPQLTLPENPFSLIKPEEQILAELKNIKEHGITHATCYQTLFNIDQLNRFLTVYKEAGLATDKLYTLGTQTDAFKTGVTQAALNKLRRDVLSWQNVAENNEFGEVFIFGLDEGEGQEITNQRPAWELIHALGSKVFASTYVQDFDLTYDILDVPVVAFDHISQEQVAQWHANGGFISSYSNPQGGVEDPEIYRRNYGFALFAAGYDGAMNFAYQYRFGEVWNDFDHNRYRDHNFTYPTTHNVIDTIQWEGYREAIDDIKYISTLIDLDPNRDADEIRAWLRPLLAQHSDLNALRGVVIEEILAVIDRTSAQCSDGIDNDSDGRTDFPADPDCSSPTDDNEAVEPQAVSIWSDADIPPGNAASDEGAVELGMKFQSEVNGSITGVRFYKFEGNDGPHIGNLWSSDGTNLATGNFVNEAASGWQQLNFDNPVAINANTTYVASYFAPKGRYAFNGPNLTARISNGFLNILSSSEAGGNGLFDYGASSRFPNSSYNASNYWVDVVFIPESGTPPLNQCSDGIDNDSDGLVDFPTDPDCSSSSDDNETADSTIDTTNPSIVLTGPGDGATVSNSVTITAHATDNVGIVGVQFRLNGNLIGGEDQSFPYAVTFDSTTVENGSYQLSAETRDAAGNTATSAEHIIVVANQGSTNPQAVSIWSDADIPPGGAALDEGAVELGMKFQSNVNGMITGVRFYKFAINDGPHVGNLWSSDGTNLATGTFVNETPSGWQQLNFDSPVAISANTTYVASYFAPNGRYAFNGPDLMEPISNGPIQILSSSEADGNGLFDYGSTSRYPSRSYNASNYWVDVVFIPQSNGSNQP